MATASIPVDLYNPGQVFACLGFMEAADILCGNAEGGFDWTDETDVQFRLVTDGKQSPVEAVLEFLAKAELITICPAGIEGIWPDNAKRSEEFPSSPYIGLKKSDLPVLLQRDSFSVQVSHWLKVTGLQPHPFKLFAGKQIGAQLMRNMLSGDHKKKGSKGFRDIFWKNSEKTFNIENPFSEVCVVGGRLGFDARGGWESLMVGTSLDKQGVLLEIAPHLELLAAIGLENARPEFLSTYEIRYATWNESLPITLCRIAFCTPDAFLPKDQFRFFRAHLGNDKQYKKCFFAEQEI